MGEELIGITDDPVPGKMSRVVHEPADPSRLLEPVNRSSARLITGASSSRPGSR